MAGNYQKEMNVLNAILKQTTELSTAENGNSVPDSERNFKQMSEEDKEFLKKVLEEVKGHKDLVDEIKEMLPNLDENFEDLEEYAYDIDLAVAMAVNGLYNQVKSLNYQHKNSLIIGSICAQNNEKVQKLLAADGITENLLQELNQKVSSENSSNLSNLLPQQIQLLSSIVRGSPVNQTIFDQNSGQKLLLEILLRGEDERLLLKTLFFVNYLFVEKDSLTIASFKNFDLTRLYSLHPESYNYSEQLMKFTGNFRQNLPENIKSSIKDRMAVLVRNGFDCKPYLDMIKREKSS